MPNQNSARKERPQETKSSVSTPFASSNGEEFQVRKIYESDREKDIRVKLFKFPLANESVLSHSNSPSVSIRNSVPVSPSMAGRKGKLMEYKIPS